MIKQHKNETNIRTHRQVLTANLDGSYKIDNLRFATVNARSLKSKKTLISEAMEEYKLDALITTETTRKMTNGLNHLKSIQMDIKYKPSTELTREDEELH